MNVPTVSYGFISVSKTHKRSKTFPNVAKLSQSLQNPPECSKTLPKLFLTLQNSPNSPRSCETLQNSLKRNKTLPNTPKNYQTPQNCTKRSKRIEVQKKGKERKDQRDHQTITILRVSTESTMGETIKVSNKPDLRIIGIIALSSCKLK